MALRYTCAFMTDFPSSLMAQMPACFIAAISVTSVPACPFVTAPTGSTFNRPTFAAFSRTYFTTSAQSVTGLVFGIGQMVVYPPRTAAFEPLSMSSLYSSPGSLKCTCRSISPGMTKHPEASITSSAFSSRFFPLFSITPSETNKSLTSSTPSEGSRTLPDFINNFIHTPHFKL